MPAPRDGSERVGAIIVAAGRSARAGQDKIWADLGGRPAVAYALERIGRATEVDQIVLVVQQERYHAAEQLLRELGIRATLQVGGPRRRDSVRSGLRELGACQWVVVHDGARPFPADELPRLGLDAARPTGAAVAAIRARDTVKRVQEWQVQSTPPREEMWLVQTPQVFRRELLEAALDSSDEDVTDEATLLERMGIRVRVFAGNPENFKITTTEDMDFARAWLRVLQSRGDASRGAEQGDGGAGASS